LKDGIILRKKTAFGYGVIEFSLSNDRYLYDLSPIERDEINARRNGTTILVGSVPAKSREHRAKGK